MFTFFRSIIFLCAVGWMFIGCSKKDENPVAQQNEIHGELISSSATNAVVSSTNSKPATAPVVMKSPEKSGEYVEVGFDKLAGYTFEVPEGIISAESEAATKAKSEGQIPKDVKAFDQKKVSLKGFMLPLKVDDGLVTEMLIMKDQSMCCYGAVPRINDWVSVKMGGKGVPAIMDEAVTLYGKLHVGEMLENGYLVGIYQMDGEKMKE